MHDPRLTTGLGNSLIKCLVEDHDRRIWVGTDSGLYIYDPEMEHFSAVPLYADDGKPVTKPGSDPRLRPGGPRLDRRGE